MVRVFINKIKEARVKGLGNGLSKITKFLEVVTHD